MSRADQAAYAPPFRDGPGFGPVETVEEESGRGPLLLGVSVAVLLALIGIIWITYGQGVREGGRDAPPRIAPSVDPYKVEPADRGGVETAHLDIRVFDVMEDAPAAVPVPDDVAAEETPGTEAASAEAPAQDEALSQDEVAGLLGLTPTTVTDVQIPAAPSDARVPEARPGPVELEGPRTLDGAEQGSDDIEGALEPSQRVNEIAEPQGAPAPARAGREAPSNAVEPPVELSAYFVQVASFRSRDAATVGWREFRAEFGEMVGRRTPDVTRADLGDRGVHYRLRVGGFADREAAADFCDQLKARDRECLVVGS